MRRRDAIGTTFCSSALRCFEDPVAERGARGRAVGGGGKAAGDLPERGELLLALRAALEVRLEGLPLGGVECIQRVAGRQLVE